MFYFIHISEVMITKVFLKVFYVPFFIYKYLTIFTVYVQYYLKPTVCIYVYVFTLLLIMYYNLHAFLNCLVFSRLFPIYSFTIKEFGFRLTFLRVGIRTLLIQNYQQFQSNSPVYPSIFQIGIDGLQSVSIDILDR